MNKSDFYKLWYTRSEDTELNDEGFPPVLWLGDPITTEEQWNDFLSLEVDVEDFLKINAEACALIGAEFIPPHSLTRTYPSISEQLDGIYKSLLAIQKSGVDLGPDGDAYINSIKEVKENNLKTHDIPAPPDCTTIFKELDPE